jgi:hypothetical protein
MSTTANRFVAQIATGQSLSGNVDIGGFPPVALRLPGGDWTAAAVSFEASEDGVSFGAVFDEDGTEYTVQVAAYRYVALRSAPFRGARSIRVRSGTYGTPVTQANGRDIIVVTGAPTPVARYE